MRLYPKNVFTLYSSIFLILWYSLVIIKKSKGTCLPLFNFWKCKKTVPYDEIHKELDVFIQHSLAMPKMNNPFILEDKSTHPIIFGYCIGVMNHIETAYALEKKERVTIEKKFILDNFVNQNEASMQTLFAHWEEIRDSEEIKEYINKGKLAMKQWQKGGAMAQYAPMGLIKLLNE